MPNRRNSARKARHYEAVEAVCRTRNTNLLVAAPTGIRRTARLSVRGADGNRAALGLALPAETGVHKSDDPGAAYQDCRAKTMEHEGSTRRRS